MKKQTICKYELKTTDIQVVNMPRNAQILSIKMQNNNPRIWALIEHPYEDVEKTFEIFGTGHYITSDDNTERRYIDTYQLKDGLAFHVFELLR